MPSKLFNKKTLRIIIAVMAVVVIGVTAWLFNSQKSSEIAQASWFNEDWYYRKAFTISPANIDEDLTNFPVAVYLATSTSMASFDNFNADGSDIRFTDQSGNLLDYEIEQWRNGITTSTVWVNVPTVHANSDTIIYMYYGNPSASVYENAKAVWDDNFVSVYHLDDDTGSNIANSASDLHDGTTGSPGVPNYQQGTPPTWEGHYWNNSAYIDIPDHDELSNFTTFTLEAWVANLYDVENSNNYPLISKGNAANSKEYRFRLITTTGVDSLNCHMSTTGSDEQGGSHGVTLSGTPTHYYFACAWDGSNTDIFVNGALGSSPGASGTMYDAGVDIRLGTYSDTSNGLWGYMDEVRISNINRSDAWIKATYYSVDNQLLSVDSEEQGPGPLMYLSFDEGYGTTAYDQSPNNYDGTVSGATWTDNSQCKVGKCLYFDGTDDWVELVGDRIWDDMPLNFTFSTWFKAMSLGESSNGRIFDSGGGDDTGPFTINLNTSNRLTFQSYDGAAGSIVNSANNTVKLGAWQHLVVTYTSTGIDDGEIRIYMDGVFQEKASGNLESPLGTSDNTVRIGARPSDGDREFEGYIDEFKFYNYVRSADQIKLDYNQGFAVSFGTSNPDSSLSDGLVGYWPMDESASSTCDTALYDSCDASGNGNDANWFGGTTATSTAKFGRGVEPDLGDGVALYADDDSSLRMQELTLSAWINGERSLSAMADGYPTIVSKQDWGNNSGYNLGVHTDSNNHIGFRLMQGATTDDRKELTYDYTGSDEWIFVTATYDGEYMRLYKDGEEQANSNIGSIVINHNTRNISIAENYEGRIDEVRIYNRALSPDEVRRLYEWAPGPVMYMKFDENTGTSNVYSSAAATTSVGTMNGLDEADWVTGRLGSALDFDGTDDYIEIDDNDALDLNVDNFSIMAWVFPRSWGQGSNGRIIDHGGGSSGSAGWTLNMEETGDMFDLQVNGAEYGSTSGIADINEWQHVAITVNNGLMENYVNGVLKGDTPAHSDVQRPTKRSDPVRIGQRATDSLRQFDGIIDEVKLYDYARSPRQVMEDMHASQRNNPLVYWSFDEGQGTTAYDQGIHAVPHINDALNGTLTDMTTTGTSSAWKVNGRVGGALDFDGVDDEVLAPANKERIYPHVGLRLAFSWSAWFKADSDGEGDNGAIIHRNSNSSIKLSSESAGKMDLTASLDLDTSNATLTLTKAITQGQWHHVVVTYTDDADDEINVYLDGEYQGSSTNGSGGPAYDSDTFAIGGSYDNTTNNFDGMIDEVKVYNYELTLDEVRENYNAGVQTQIGNPAGAPSEVAEGLVGWWKMDEASWSGNDDEVRDYSGLDNHGKAYNSANSTSTAKFGRAGEFNGSQRLMMGDSNSLDIANNFTLSAWVNSSSLSGDKMITSKGWNGDINYDFYTYGDEIECGFEDAGDTYYSYTTTAVNLQTDTWYHLACVYDDESDSLSIYRNGALVLSAKSEYGLLKTNVGALVVGQEWAGNGWSGMIDDLKIWNKALSPDQIMREYADMKPPVAHWRFDEMSGDSAVDSSGMGITGDLAKPSNSCPGHAYCPTWQVRGKKGSALEFDGVGSIIEIPSNTLIEPTRITVAAWVFIDQLQSSGGKIVCKGECQSNGTLDYVLQVYPTSVNFTFRDSDGNLQDTIWSTTLNTGQWYHLVGAYDGYNSKLYVDGVEQATTAFTGIMDTRSSYLYIGSTSVEDSSRTWDGKIDEVKIWDYGLTPRQVAMEYNSGGPIGYWKFDKGEGGTAYDYSGNGYDGTIWIGDAGFHTSTSSAWEQGVNGKINGSINIDTDDYIEVAHNSDLNMSSSHTISAWIYPDRVDLDYQTLVIKGLASDENYYLQLYQDEVNFGFYDGGSYRSYTTTDVNLQTVTWYHILGVFDDENDRTRIYVNGEKALDQANTYTPDSDNTDTLLIGTSSSGAPAAEDYNGNIDEVKVWNYALTPEDIRKEYNGGFATFFQ